ncbi:MAG TPA: hypothetical protein ENN29_09775 [Candidatus Hydrogenedentes bacterium]|nr:hypothetical protein [Candidatus Hydrogenedentota bacterium]
MAKGNRVSEKKTTEGKQHGGVFHLPKTLKQKIRECARGEKANSASKVFFLWACVTEKGLKQGVKKTKGKAKKLTKQEWLTVVDEAASLGANWFVLSFGAPLAECGDIWDVCKWAQTAHGMMVGLHVKGSHLTRRDLSYIKALDLRKTRILARKGALRRIKLTGDEKESLIVWTANPQAEGERPNCQGPSRMIFVNANGELYTCGLVEGKAEYRMGHVFDRKLGGIISDLDLPHHVDEEIHYVTPECDGCPALIANYFSENL